MRAWDLFRPPVAAAGLLTSQLLHAAYRTDLPTLENQDPTARFGDPSLPEIRLAADKVGDGQIPTPPVIDRY